MGRSPYFERPTPPPHVKLDNTVIHRTALRHPSDVITYVGIIAGEDGRQICWTSRETMRKYSVRVSGKLTRQHDLQNEHCPLLFIEETVRLTSQGNRMNVLKLTVTIQFNTWYDF
jgi:hypothetical protein